MGWVKDALKELSETGECKIRPLGNSMKGKIESGQLVTIIKIDPKNIEIDDIAFIKWKGNYLLHLIKEIQEDKVLIGNNLGKINGWIPLKDVIGKVIKIED